MFFSGSKWSRKQVLSLTTILLLSLVLMGLRWQEIPVGSFTDDAYYVELARSLAEGLGPVLQVGPDVSVRNPDIFPVGFPLLLSPLAKVFPHSLDSLKVVPLLATILLLPICLWLPGPKADNRLRIALAAVVMLNPWVLAWSGRILSDNPFSILSLGALLFYLRLEKSDAAGLVSWLALGVLTVAALSVRTIGWAVVASLVLLLLRRRQFKRAILFGVLVVFLLGLFRWVMGSGFDFFTKAYRQQMFSQGDSSALELIWYNLTHYIGELPVLLLPVFGKPMANMFVTAGMGSFYSIAIYAIGFMLLIVVVLAIFNHWRHPLHGPRVRLFAIYLGIYALVLINFDGYPSGVQTRLLLPVLPVFVWLFFLGLGGFRRQGRHQLQILVLGLMILASLVHNGWRIVHPLGQSVAADGSGFVDPGQGARWVAENTKNTAVIMAQEPLQRHIHWQRPVVAFPGAVSAEELVATVGKYGVSYIFVGPSVHYKPHQLDERGSAVLRVLKERPEIFSPVWADVTQAVYIFERSAQGQP